MARWIKFALTNNVAVYDYFREVLTKIPNIKSETELIDLLPQNFVTKNKSD